MTKVNFGKMVGAQVEITRLKADMSVRELARRSGVAQSPIAKLCRGESTQVSVYVLGKVATALDVGLDYLTGRHTV